MLSLSLVLNPCHPGRRPKPEIVASKEQQIQRDDPGAGLQSSSQPDHGRLSRKPSRSEGQAVSNQDKLSQRACCCRLNEVRVLRSKFQ